ncbi:MAG: hypothetical protein OXC26_13515 [Albidovulum sp.]|nr:hypothetical protein [Albidovulum sp.]
MAEIPVADTIRWKNFMERKDAWVERVEGKFQTFFCIPTRTPVGTGIHQGRRFLAMPKQSHGLKGGEYRALGQQSRALGNQRQIN